jgi:hypothetical protein
MLVGPHNNNELAFPSWLFGLALEYDVFWMTRSLEFRSLEVGYRHESSIAAGLDATGGILTAAQPLVSSWPFRLAPCWGVQVRHFWSSALFIDRSTFCWCRKVNTEYRFFQNVKAFMTEA